MLERVIRIITRYNMFRAGQRVGVAVSGGADSVCLLHLLKELAPRWDLALSVLHLDHGLRGGESREDARFVRDLAARLGLPCRAEAVDVAALCRETGDNLEQAARRARAAFFQGLLRAREVDRVATGHTRSDQAETVLFRFLRGAGSAGLAGIRPVTADGLVRPFLDIERPEVEHYLRERKIVWREDATNRSLDYDRNRLRWELLPMLAMQWNPAIAATLAHTADWALGEEAYWETEIARIASEHLLVRAGTAFLRAGSLAALPPAVARRLVRRVIEIVKPGLRSIDFRHVETVLEVAAAAQGHGRVQVPGVNVFRSFDWIRFAPPGTDRLENRDFCLRLPVPGEAAVPAAGSVIQIEMLEKNSPLGALDWGYNINVGCLDRERISGTVELRNWRPGDQYQPIGHSGREKIKTLFQKARVPLWERRKWPILISGGVIVWCRCFGVSAEHAANAKSREILRVRELPGEDNWNLYGCSQRL